MKRQIPLAFIFIPVIILLVLLDQWTKRLATAYLKGKPPVPLIPGVFELSYVENRGAAFGIFQGGQVFFSVVTVGVCLLVLYLIMRTPRTRRYLPLLLAFLFLLSGAAGNFIDRVFQGYVVDFLYFSLIDFPVFNVADCFVSVSAVLLAILLMFYYREDETDFLFSLRGKKNEADS